MNERRKPQNPWVRAGIFGALGFEFVAFTLVGVWGGNFIDDYFNSSPWGLLACLLLSLVGAGIHLLHITRRFLVDE